MSITSQSTFDELWNLHPAEKGKVIIFGKELETPRWQQAFGEDYRFSGMNHLASPLTHPFLIHLSNRIWEVTGYPFLQVLVNWYENGNHHIGWHSDDESQLVDSSLDNRFGIYSFSFGATRRFDLRGKKMGTKTLETVSEVEMDVVNNSCVKMCGETQKCYKHQIPAQKRCKDRRVNVTFRLLKTTYALYSSFYKEIAHWLNQQYLLMDIWTNFGQLIISYI